MKIYARNCEIVDVSKDTMMQFLNENQKKKKKPRVSRNIYLNEDIISSL